jgi:nicotinamide-nucleotide amidase
LNQVFCSIITIGDELLIGQTIDTNSAWIAQQLNTIGILVKHRIAVGDNKQDILYALDEESKQVSLIILTGGLGPTADDITKPLLCEYFDTEMIENREVLAHVTKIFIDRNRPILEVNLRQAMLPKNCQVLFNQVGTAAGMWFEKNNVVYISLPGVPFEMMHILEEVGLAKIKAHFVTPNIIHRTLVTSGEGESFIANRLIDFEKQLPNTIKLAYLPKLGVVKLRLTAIDVEDVLVENQFRKLQNLLSNITVAAEDIELEKIVFNLLQQTGTTLSIAESCTGGLLASRITSIRGSSKIFKGGFVPYSIESKVNLLQIPESFIEQYNVVSSEVALAMAHNCMQQYNSDFALSITGHLEKQETETIAWIGLSSKEKSVSKKINLFYDREKNAVLATNTALNLLRMFILQR